MIYLILGLGNISILLLERNTMMRNTSTAAILKTPQYRMHTIIALLHNL